MLQLREFIQTCMEDQLQAIPLGNKEDISYACEGQMRYLDDEASREFLHGMIKRAQEVLNEADWEAARAVLWLAWFTLISGVPFTLVGITTSEEVLERYLEEMDKLLN